MYKETTFRETTNLNQNPDSFWITQKFKGLYHIHPEQVSP